MNPSEHCGESNPASLTDTPLQSALECLAPPAEDLLLDENLRHVAPKIDVLLAEGLAGSETLQAHIAVLGKATTPLTPLRGGTAVSSIADRSLSSIVSLLQGLYLPVDTPGVLVPPHRRYWHAQTWPAVEGSSGSAAAYIESGKLITIQSATLSASQTSTWAGLYIRYRTDLATHGQVSRISYQPEIDWIARHHFDIDFVWRSRVDGNIAFANRIWLVAYEYNAASRRYEALTGTSARVVEVVNSVRYITSSGMWAYSGSLHDDAGFQFIASPARDYLLGVVLENRCWHNLRSADAGQPIRPPNPNEFVVYSLFKAEVPAMWVSHQVLAR